MDVAVELLKSKLAKTRLLPATFRHFYGPNNAKPKASRDHILRLRRRM
jgi:hypothetical protein